MAATKQPKLTPAQLAALRQYRENLQAGDPDMSRVTTKTADALLSKRLIACCYYGEENSDVLSYRWDLPFAGVRGRVFERAMIPTRAGLELLEALDAGEVRS